MKVYLKGRSLRDYALFVVGINVALRISDLLKLTWADVSNKNNESFKSIKIIEGKTEYCHRNRPVVPTFRPYNAS